MDFLQKCTATRKKRGGGGVEDQTPSADVSASAADDLQKAK